MARPTSPTSLLWAHQLKLQHAHLLERMNKLEEANKTLKKVVESAQIDDAALQDVVSDRAGLASRMTAAESVNRGLQERLESVTRQSQTGIASLEARVREVHERVQTLEGKYEEGRRIEGQILSTQEALLQKIGQMHSELTEHMGGTQLLRRKNDPADTVVLSRRLEAIEARRNEDSLKIRAMGQRIRKFELTELGEDSCELLREARHRQLELESSPDTNSDSRPVPVTPTPNLRSGRPTIGLFRLHPKHSHGKGISHQSGHSARRSSAADTPPAIPPTGAVAPQGSEMPAESLPKCSANSTKKRKAKKMLSPAREGRRMVTRAEAKRREVSGPKEPERSDLHMSSRCTTSQQTYKDAAGEAQGLFRPKRQRRQIVQLHDLQALS